VQAKFALEFQEFNAKNILMRIIVRISVVVVLGWVMLVLFQKAHVSQGINPDPSKLILYYLGVVGLGVVIGGIVSMSVLPAIGDQVGSFFYNPSTEIEKDPHHRALVKLANGDFQAAIDEYGKVVEKNPADTLALSEMVRIYCDKLHEPEPAAALLEGALQQEHWSNDDVAFLGERLVDIYWLHQRDGARSRSILLQIAEQMPETKHAANALHRLHEIDRAMLLG
jgi:tetratricopeptide (TPR) repeat protein